jgi:hypothetical protein
MTTDHQNQSSEEFAMFVSWILSMLEAVASLVSRLNLSGVLGGLRSGEPRAWLIVIGGFLGLWSVISLLGSNSQHTAYNDRRFRRQNSTWDRLDGE